MPKNKYSRPLKTSLTVLCTGLILSACQSNTLTGQSVPNDAFNFALNPLSKGEQLNPISKGEQLNPISKGEQLNPGSKGERLVYGEIELVGSTRPLANQELQFLLDGQPIPTDWIALGHKGEQRLQYAIQKLPNDGIHILELRYLGHALGTMVPPETSQLNLDLRSSLIVTAVRFANTESILSFSQWTPALLKRLIDSPDLNPLLENFAQEATERSPNSLNRWLDQAPQRNALRSILNNLAETAPLPP